MCKDQAMEKIKGEKDGETYKVVKSSKVSNHWGAAALLKLLLLKSLQNT